MKYLLVLLVVVIGLWLLLRGRGGVDGPGPKRPRGHGHGRDAQTIVACAHCGVHLPRPDAVDGSGGQLYCSDAHRLAGPR